MVTLAAVAISYVAGCTPVRHNLPPAQRLLEPGPGVGGPGPGVMSPNVIPASASMPMDGGACGPGGPGYGMPGPGASVQILFNRPEGMEVLYDVVGDGSFTSTPLSVPGRVEFPQGGIYRLKLTKIQGDDRFVGVELYPTVEIAGANPRTAAYLAHNAIPISFSVSDDLPQVLAGNFVTKVIYLPDPEFQGDALVGVEEVVSNRINPGEDPIVEADRRGSILAIVRLGNKDIEMSGAAGANAALAMGPMMGPMGPGGMPPMLPGMVAGVTAPEYGMTYSGTPIGLPGPPHIPLGSPAGLQKHVMRNHTHMNIPDPVEKMKIHVRSTPGQSYPQPVSRVRIHEQNIHPGYPTGQPASFRRSQHVGGGQDGEYCPPQ
ncbi:MAG: hypothetical protein IT423_03025 [Pirellulaceae bacterium]|nr:hypothetical protein [Pirellulaceae bacterium]